MGLQHAERVGFARFEGRPVWTSYQRISWAVCNASCCCASGESLSLAGKASGLVKTSTSGKNASGSSNEIVSLRNDKWRWSQRSCCEKPTWVQEENGGDGQEDLESLDTCSLGQVRSGQVYYIARRLPSTFSLCPFSSSDALHTVRYINLTRS